MFVVRKSELRVRTLKLVLIVLIGIILCTMISVDFDMLSPKPRQKIWIHRKIKTIERDYPGDLSNDSHHYHYQAKSEDTVYDLELNLKPSAPENFEAKPKMAGVNTINAKISDDRDSKQNLNNSIENSFDLIFSAYMRSGSTIIGKLFGNRFDTFYFFEPLWKVAKFQYYTGKESLCHYYLPDCSNATNNVDNEVKQINESMDYLQSIFDCSFHKYADFMIDTDFKEFGNAKHDWSFHKGFRWDDFKACRQNQSRNFKGCLKAAKVRCSSAEHRVVKLLRMTMDNLEILLQRNKNLKIIHLFRDPRGIINSHFKTKWFINRRHIKDPHIVQKDARVMCTRMMIDLKAGKILLEKYNDRIKFIQYEDLESILRDKVPILNEFVGMKYEKKQARLIKRFFEPSRHSEKKGFHPYSYRTTLPWETVRVVDRECAELLKQLGYTVYNSERHLRNLSQPAAVEPLPFAV